jgi:hypothetical protein
MSPVLRDPAPASPQHFPRTGTPRGLPSRYDGLIRVDRELACHNATSAERFQCATGCNSKAPSLNPDGKNAAPFSVSVTTKENAVVPRQPRAPNRFWNSPVTLLLGVGVCFAVATLLAPQRYLPRGSRARLLVPASAVVFFALLGVGCSGGSTFKPVGTPAGTYSLTITGSGAAETAR